MNTTTEIYDYEIRPEQGRLSVRLAENADWKNYPIAWFFDFIAPVVHGWNEPETQSIIFQGPEDYRLYYDENGPQMMPYPCRAERMTWENFIKEYSYELEDMISQFINCQ